MGVKQDILDHISALKNVKCQSTLWAINDILKANTTLEMAEGAVASIKDLLTAHDAQIEYINEFEVDVEALPDPELPE